MVTVMNLMITTTKPLNQNKMEQNFMVKHIEDTASQLQNLKDEAEVNNKIIVAQEEMIQLLQLAVQERDKFIAFLESQLKIQDNAINKEI